MAKRFRLRLSLPASFQFCRFKQPSSFPKSPKPVTYGLFSPVNPKEIDIGYPNFPDPPPSTPNFPSFKRHVSSKIIPVSRKGRSKSSTHDECNTHKMYNSPVSVDFDDSSWPISPPKLELKKKRDRNRKKKPSMSISSADSGWFSSEGGDQNEETESLFSTSRSFDSSYDCGYSLETISEKPIDGGGRRKKKNNNIKVRRLKRYVSNSWKVVDKTKTTATTPESDHSPVKKSVLRRLMTPPCMEDGKVSESFAVVKRSEDPYGDFKRSMLEMILEKQMFEAKDLEQLLQCFLSLNTRHHHAAIVQAFSEIWEDLFCKSP